MYTETRDFIVSTSTGASEKGSLGTFGGAYSGMVMMSNWETKEIVIVL